MYKWSIDLETGNEEIDSQHKQLIAVFNNIIDAFKQNKDKEEIFKTLNFLNEYTIEHFSAEEELMKNYKYFDFSKHKGFHDEFKVMVDNFNQQVAKDGPSNELVNSVLLTLGDWLRNHIKGDDFRMAAYVKTKKLIISGDENH